jgi:hypothetical protein
MTGRRLHPRLPAAAGLAAALLLAGCSHSTPAGEQDPQVLAALSTVESAIAGHDYGQARTALDRLADRAAQDRRDGTLTDDQATRVLAAAAQLRADLPVTPTAVPTRTEDHGDDGDNSGRGRGGGDNSGGGGGGDNSGSGNGGGSGNSSGRGPGGN